ncbi:MAG: hypothetical protein ACR2IH_05525 [Pyrinomonadaceae bacterium]
MSQQFQPGDFLIFQLESGYGLLRILDMETNSAHPVWHLAAYTDLFLDVDTADKALEQPEKLSVSHPHIALTNRAFESTQVAKMKNEPLTATDLAAYSTWKNDASRGVSDRSVRLMLGIR